MRFQTRAAVLMLDLPREPRPMPFSGEGAANPGVALGASAGLPAPLSVWPRWRDRSMLFETELGECLGNKTFLISLAAHGQVEDHRCDTLPDRLRGRGDEAGRKRHQKPQAYLEGDEAGRHGSVGALDALLIEYVSAFVPKMTGEHFSPHVSTGVASREYLNGMLAEPFAPFIFSPAGAAVYQLGAFGTAAKKLREWDLKQ
jgi:hypothetical protein